MASLPRPRSIAAAVVLLLAWELTAPGRLSAQYTETAYFETWADIATIYNVGDRFRYDGDYGVRAFLSTPDFSQIYLRPSVRYEVAPWLRVHGGLAWFHTFFPDNEDADEIRPWVGARIVGPRPGGFLIQNYLRLEMRAFEFGGDQGGDTVWRGRWQLQVRSPDFRIGSVERFYAVAFGELFHTYDSEVEGLAAERLRLNLGLGRTFSRAWRVELNGMFQHGRVEEGVTGFDLDEGILRLRMFYTFN
jgi:hypothetical protein